MYGEGNVLSTVAPPVVAAGTVAVLPATGADFFTSLATAVGLGMATWGALYLYKVWRG